MKKIYSLLALLLFVPSFAFAQEPLYGFLDGKIYNQEGIQKYICFLDNQCIDKDNNVYTRDQLFADTPVPQYSDAVPHPYDENQVFPNQMPVVNQPSSATTTPTDLKTQYQQQLTELNNQIQQEVDKLEACKTQTQQKYAGSGITVDGMNTIMIGACHSYIDRMNELSIPRDNLQAKLNALQ